MAERVPVLGGYEVKAWHFVNDTLRDGRPIPEDGEWLEHDGELRLCHTGLHASESIRDALDYAPGKTLCRVELGGEIIKSDDKAVASKRKILWRIDAENLLWEASRKFALEVIHLWDAPPVVREFLETGNEDLRDAAWVAARDAAGAAAGAAARDAAGDAAWAAAWAAARDAAGAAAWDAAWAAAWDAAGDAARDAAWAAARDAAGAAAGDAAWAAAWAAARKRQEEILLEIIERARNEQA